MRSRCPVVPDLWSDSEAEQAAATSTAAVLQMSTIDVAALQAAADG